MVNSFSKWHLKQFVAFRVTSLLKNLIAGINSYGFSLSSMRLIHSYLSNRQQKAMISSTCSSGEEILFLASHKFPYSDCFFIIFTCNLFSILNNICFAKSADDTAPYFIGDGAKEALILWKILQMSYFVSFNYQLL